MSKTVVLFIQQNLARRHNPTATLNKLLDDLSLFSQKRRHVNYLAGKLRRDEILTDCSFLYELADGAGLLPRVQPVALVQEPNVRNSKVTGFSDKLVLSCGTNPRAAIITTKNANVSLINNLSTPDFALCKLSSARENLLISSFYSDLNECKSRSNIARALNEGITRNQIHAGDANAHSGSWG